MTQFLILTKRQKNLTDVCGSNLSFIYNMHFGENLDYSRPHLKLSKLTFFEKNDKITKIVFFLNSSIF